MDNLIQHFTEKPILLVMSIIALLIIINSIPYFLNQYRRYGSATDFASKSRKVLTGGSVLLLVGVLFYGLTPYVAPPTDDIALVLGNTKNTPAPLISEDISNALEQTMLLHKGDDVDELAESIKIISAVKTPEVVELDAEKLKLEKISNNTTNAKRAIKKNVAAIEKEINSLLPSDSGANYFEAILEAKDNVEEGSKIVVIGSGLSDYGDINFSKSKILTNEEVRETVIDEVKEKYGRDYLANYTIEFYGIGDSVAPQEDLSNKQKEIVRDFYEDVVGSLGGDAVINTQTKTGESVTTEYVVGTTDTGCGDIGLIFDNDSIEFIGNQATFKDEAAAKSSLMQVKTIWDGNQETIKTIQIDGYIAHYPGTDTLSQPRADLVKAALIDLGIPQDTLNATGKGFGPHEKDSQNRMVKITISRDNEQCQN